jgi:UDP-glucose 4-epimerase
MRILLTGGAGFIGSHVADAFLSAGHEVAVVDNLSTGNRDNLNHEARFYELDIRDREALEHVFAEFRPEIVDHHAAQAKVPISVANPAYDAEVNLIGGINVLKAAVDHGVRKVIFISTGGALYGEPDIVPCDESQPIRPLSPYGTSKYCFEQYLGTFGRTFGLPYTTLRYSNVYGPRQDLHAEEGRVVAIFAERILKDAPLTIDGDGEQARDMLYVSDAVAANLSALERGDGEAYNIGTGIATTVNALFTTLARLGHYRREPIHGPARVGDVRRIAIDCSKAERELDWRPRVSLEQGLAATLEAMARTVGVHDPAPSAA